MMGVLESQHCFCPSVPGGSLDTVLNLITMEVFDYWAIDFILLCHPAFHRYNIGPVFFE